MSSTEDQPTVTVVVPALNAADTIGEQLDALAGQLFDHDWEVVVVDNGSTDGTGDVARRARRHSRCELRVINESRRGLNVARNAGVRAARAERIAICDADDVVDGTWLEHLCAKLDDADLVGGGLAFDRLNDDTVLALRGWDEGVGPSPSVGRELGHLAQIIGANMAFRIGVWTAIGGFDEGLTRGGDDVDFAWRAQMSEYTLASCPEAVVHYRGRASKRALFHQYVRDGHGAAHLFKLHRQSGMPRRPVLLAMKSILAVVAKVPWLPLLDTRRQGHVVRAAGKQWGRVLGSLNHRVVYL